MHSPPCLMCPQYTELGRLRELYPPVPIIALTATANKRTVADIISQLKLRDDHAAFTQSFNRTNLRYIVHEKKGSLIDNIVSSLQTKYRGQAGVIYCHARRTCEQVAESLQKKGIVAAFFHAKMPTEEKDQTVRDWQAGEVPVIVATVSAVFVSISCFFSTLLSDCVRHGYRQGRWFVISWSISCLLFITGCA